MKHHRVLPIRFPQSDERMSPFEWLTEAFVLERNDSNVERIRLMRAAHFADGAALRESGTLKIPNSNRG